MFNKRFKSKTDPSMNQMMREIAQQLMGVRWIVWLSSNGLARAGFPEELGLDRPSAMGTAMLSLGERISTELRGGLLRCSLIAGEEEWHLLTVLDKDNALLFGLHPQTSIDAVLAAVRETLAQYAPWLKGVSSAE